MSPPFVPLILLNWLLMQGHLGYGRTPSGVHRYLLRLFYACYFGV